jgi:hypothetical protein
MSHTKNESKEKNMSGETVKSSRRWTGTQAGSAHLGKSPHVRIQDPAWARCSQNPSGVSRAHTRRKRNTAASNQRTKSLRAGEFSVSRKQHTWSCAARSSGIRTPARKIGLKKWIKASSAVKKNQPGRSDCAGTKTEVMSRIKKKLNLHENRADRNQHNGSWH